MPAAQRYRTIDALRGLAATSVLVSHWMSWTPAGAGVPARAVSALAELEQFFWTAGGIHPGVVVFIVISGFCIHLPLAARPDRESAPGFWRTYARRRSFRIFPVYWLGAALGLCAVFTAAARHVALPFPSRPPSLTGILATFSGLADLVQLARPLVPTVPGVHFGNGPLGTLAVEILLYATYPFLLFLRRRSGAVSVLALGSIAYAVLAGLRMVGIPPALLQGSYLEFLLYWILGAAAVELTMRHRLPRAAVMAASLLVLYLAYIHTVHFRGAYVVSTVLLAACTALTLAAGVQAEQKGYERWMLSILARFGLRSYSLYAVHTPMIAFAFVLLPGGWVRWMSMAMTFGATELVYRLVELPSHRLARGSPAAPVVETAPVMAP